MPPLLTHHVSFEETDSVPVLMSRFLRGLLTWEFITCSFPLASHSIRVTVGQTSKTALCLYVIVSFFAVASYRHHSATFWWLSVARLCVRARVWVSVYLFVCVCVCMRARIKAQNFATK